MTPEVDPFAAVRVKPQSQKPAQTSRNEDENNEQDPFASVRVKKSEDIPMLYETGRHAARIGSRIAETIGGIPGDVSSLIQSGIFSGLEAITGHKASKEAHEKVKQQRPPTSKELKEFSEKETGGFTKAQNEAERIGDEIAETAASLLGPMKFRKVLGVSLASQFAKEGLKVGGLGEGAQEAGKLGTMFLASLYNPGGALKYASSQYSTAQKLAKGASIKASSFENNIQHLINDLEKGVTTTEKNSVLKPTREILQKISNGKISVDDLIAAKRDINSIIGEPETLRGAKKLLNVLGKQVDNAIKPFEKVNPAFEKAYRPANEIYGAVMQGQKAANFIKKNLGNKSFLGAALIEIGLGHPEYIAPTIAGAAGIKSLAKTADFIDRLSRSKELQKFYTKALAAAAAEDSIVLRKYEDKIDEYIENH